MRLPSLIWVVFCGVALSGCASTVKETHYFASFPKAGAESEKPVNFFRLKVKGGAQLSSSRYLAGFYDERAVDLFFNEIRTSRSYHSTLFKTDLKDPGTSDVIKPLSPASGSGAFVLILSTDADSVANAIGSFAESEVVANAVTNLIAKDKIEKKMQSDAAIGIASNRGKILVTQLDTLVANAAEQTQKKAVEKAYLRILNALARTLGNDSSFTTFDEARQWFQLEAATSGG